MFADAVPAPSAASAAAFSASVAVSELIMLLSSFSKSAILLSTASISASNLLASDKFSLSRASNFCSCSSSFLLIRASISPVPRVFCIEAIFSLSHCIYDSTDDFA